MQEITKLNAEVAKFGRIGDQRSPQRLGEMTEMEMGVQLPLPRKCLSRYRG